MALGPKPTTFGSVAARIETGTIADVNANNMTVGWLSQYSGRYWAAVPIMAPYFHYNNGEGFTVVPEVGAIAAVCFPSDEPGIPFVLGFLSASESSATSQEEVSIGEPGVETDELTAASGNATAPVSAGPNYRNGRPLLKPGDMIWYGRDDNFVVLHRGGVLQIGSTNICQRIFIPVRNFMRDLCENYELTTMGGTLSWEVRREEDKPAPSQTPHDLTLVLREYVQDKKASIKLSFGSLDPARSKAKRVSGDLWVELAIAPGGIEPDDGKVSGAPILVIQVDKSGNLYTQAQNVEQDIKGDLKQTVAGNITQECGGTLNLKVKGAVTEEFGGAHSVRGPSSDEVWSGLKTISASSVLIGAQDANYSVPLGELLLQWLATHTHPSSSSPPAVPPPDGLLSRKVRVA